MAVKNEAIIVGKIKKRDDVEICGSISTYKNEFYVDLREYVETPNYKGPTKKGIRFHVENWEAFKELINNIDKELQKSL